jgi:hypothetical protein
MKRVSILGILAIIVAVASSFTTVKKVPTDAWFLLNGTLPTQAAFQSNYTTTYNRVSAYDATKRTQSGVQSICLFGSAKVCAVKIDYSVHAPIDALDDNSGNPGQGDFSSSYSTDILGYEFKN